MAIAASGRSNEPTKPWSPLHFLCLVDDPDCMPFRLNGRPPQAHNLAVCNQRARPSCPRVLSTRPLRESVMEAKKRIGDYEILGELGSGGMGRVFRVRNVISDRVEAMKVLLPDLVGRQDLAARFLREIKVARRAQSSKHRRAPHRADGRQSARHDHGVRRRPIGGRSAGARAHSQRPTPSSTSTRCSTR